MICPNCKSENEIVTDSRQRTRGRMRRHKCFDCGYKWASVEIEKTEYDELLNIKRLFERRNKFPEMLSKLLKEKRLSQNDLADKMDSSQKMVWQWTTGKSEPTLQTLIKLSDILEVSIDYLIYGGIRK